MTRVLIALVLQLALYAVFKDLWIGAAAGAAFYLGREYTQAEYRLIAAVYHNKRSEMPLLVGIDPRAWTTKGMVDWIAPSVTVMLVAVFKPYSF